MAGIDLGFDLHPTPLAGRRFLLRELLANLLHNAMAYAGSGAMVTVRCRPEGKDAVLEVEDNGPGIAPEERDAVFQRFQRGSAATQQHGITSEGSGLGLAIVRDIALGHGGRVELLGTSSGRGLRVRVTLPAALT